VTSIAHEINQPLGAIANNAAACVRWLGSQNLEEARRSASMAVAEAHRAGEIIRRVRALANKSPPKKAWIDLNQTIGEAIALAHGELKSNGVLVQTRLAKDLPLLMGDRIQLQQVILNLVVNAVEAMSGVREGSRELSVNSEKANVTLFESEQNKPLPRSFSEEGSLDEGGYEQGGQSLAETEPAHILVSVADSGSGLDAKDLDHLFDAFYTTKPQGLGMGLAISRSIIEAHGGRLWAAANKPKGARFQFTLPIDAGERAT